MSSARSAGLGAAGNCPLRLQSEADGVTVVPLATLVQSATDLNPEAAGRQSVIGFTLYHSPLYKPASRQEKSLNFCRAHPESHRRASW